MKLRSSKRTSIIGAGRMLVARRAASSSQVLADLSVIDTIVWFGASLSEGQQSGPNNTEDYKPGLANYVLQEYGRTVTIIDGAVNGNVMSDMLTRLPALLASYSGPNVLYAVECIGNDVSTTRPWSTMTTGERSALYGQVESLCQQIVATGSVLSLAATSFRNYGLNNSCASDQSLGSLPYITNIIKPLSKLYGPEFYDDAHDWPMVDMYAPFANNYAKILADEVHCTGLGYAFTRADRIDRYARRLIGEIPAFEAVRSDLLTPPTLGLPLTMIDFPGAGTGVSYFGNLLGWQAMPLAGVSNLALRPRLGITDVLFSCSGRSSGTNDFSFATPLADQHKLDAVNRCNAYWYVQADATMGTFSGLTAGQQYKIRFVSARRSTDGTSRTADWSVDDFATFITVNANVAATSTVPTINEITFTAASTSVSLKARRAAEGYVIINNLSIEQL